MAYNLPDPGKAYLTYKLEDAPDVSVKNWYNQQGKSYTKWRQLTAYNTPEYQQWKAGILQDYQNYMDAYNANYNSEASTRARLEAAKFSGQYLANGIGGSSASSSGVIPPLQQSGGESHISKGLEKMYQTLQFMSAAGIAMKNFGEGKAAMKYADDLAKNKSLLDQSKYINEKAKYDGIIAQSQKLGMEWANPADYGYKWTSEGKLEFTGKNGLGEDVSRNMYFERLVKNLESQDLTNALRQREVWMKDLDKSIADKYAEETAKAQKELLENKRDIAAIEKDYAAALKAMGVAAPVIGALMKLL